MPCQATTGRRQHGQLLGSLGFLAVALSLSEATPVRSQDPWQEHRYEEAKACKGCHGLPTADHKSDGNLDLVLMAEYPIWKTQDKHAQAYLVLMGPRGQQMGEVLFGKKRANGVLEETGGCLSCHAMHNHSKENLDKTGGQGKGLDPKDGVSCGGCHGPSTTWSGKHYDLGVWRNLSSEKKTALGMRDLRDPIERANVCVSCHVGNVAQGKIVTHAMFAAGHPPLPPIEISSFARNSPQHWRDVQAVPHFQKQAKDSSVIKNYHLEAAEFQRTRFALVGTLVALRETMKIVQDRADLETKHPPATVWPELLALLPEADVANAARIREMAGKRWYEVALSHTDCHACHHELETPGYRQTRGYGYRLSGKPPIRMAAGMPSVRRWPLSLVEVSVGIVGHPKYLDDLHELLTALAATSNAVPFGRPQEIRRDATTIVAWCDELLIELNKPDIYTKERITNAARELCRMYATEGGWTPDFETARQVAAVLLVMCDDLGMREKTTKTQVILKDLVEKFDLEPYKMREERVRLVLSVVRQLLNKEEMKGTKEFVVFAANVNDPQAFTSLGPIPNTFLQDLHGGVSNDAFTKALLEKPTIDKLQVLGDQETRVLLDAVARYDPEAFKRNLKALGERLKP